MRRFGVIVALHALLSMFGGLVTASPVLAGRGPKWQPPGASPPFTPASTILRVQGPVAFPVNHEYTKVLHHADRSTTFLFTGFGAVSYTNLRTGKTITENFPGPGKATIHADGSITEVHTGRSGPFPLLTPADAKRFGLPTVSVFSGRLAFSIDSQGNITSLSLHGHVAVDVCVALS